MQRLHEGQQQASSLHCVLKGLSATFDGVTLLMLLVAGLGLVAACTPMLVMAWGSGAGCCRCTFPSLHCMPAAVTGRGRTAVDDRSGLADSG